MAVIIKPIEDVKPLPILSGQSNGRLSPSILISTDGPNGGPRIVALQVVTWSMLAMFDAALPGIRFKVTGTADTYRTYAQQETLFRSRYVPYFEAGLTYGNDRRKYWEGRYWYLLLGEATAAVPGTSNHGWARALDLGEERDGDSGTEGLRDSSVQWLVDNAHRFGFSAELQSEDWHWRFYEDHLTSATLAWMNGDDMALTEQDIAAVALASATATWAKTIGSASLGDKPAQEFLKQGQLAKQEATAGKDATASLAEQVATMQVQLNRIEAAIAAISGPGAVSYTMTSSGTLVPVPVPTPPVEG